jgi:hypothetical protein
MYNYQSTQPEITSNPEEQQTRRPSRPRKIAAGFFAVATFVSVGATAYGTVEMTNGTARDELPTNSASINTIDGGIPGLELTWLGAASMCLSSIGYVLVARGEVQSPDHQEE